MDVASICVIRQIEISTFGGESNFQLVPCPVSQLPGRGVLFLKNMESFVAVAWQGLFVYMSWFEKGHILCSLDQILETC